MFVDKILEIGWNIASIANGKVGFPLQDVAEFLGNT